MPSCSDCNTDLARANFSKAQLRKEPSVRRCKACVTTNPGNQRTEVTGKNATTKPIEASYIVQEFKANEGTDEGIVDDGHITQGEPCLDKASSAVVDDTPAEININEITIDEVPATLEISEGAVVEDSSFSACSPKIPETKAEVKVNEGTDEGIVDDGHITQGEPCLDKASSVVVDDTPAEININEITIDEVPATLEISEEKNERVKYDLVFDEAADLSAIDVVDLTSVPTEEVTYQNDISVDQSAIGSDAADQPNQDEDSKADDIGPSQAPSLIRIGICAMDKKSRSKPMGEILNRLDKSLFEFVYFGDDLILNASIEEWPLCDVLIAFYSNGYPLDKVEEYTELRKPFLLNDLKMQRVLKDRRRVYDQLAASGIDVPRHVFMNRDGYVSNGDGNGEDGEEAELIEHDDHIEVNGVVIHKPFVEKPVDADDHNIAIYYPASAGGGCKKLFRKVGDRSSEFYPDINEIRREGSYIYEEFVETQGTDVKMYTVGPDYGHAEARKSPTVDGKVERNEDGKEVRFPVILTLREKEIARRIVIVFKQYVCGFDLLRVQEGDSFVSYVCDVNGWSFVKNSRKYYDDCAQILTEHMLAAVKPKALHGFSALDPLMKICKNVFVQTPRRKRHKAFARASSGQSQTDSCPQSPTPVKEIESPTDDSSILSNQNAAATLEEGALPVREMPDMLMNKPASRSATSSANGDDDAQMSVASTEHKASTSGTHQEELRCVIAVVRHGDRTPKQKLKVNMSEPLLLDYFHKHSKKKCKKDLKIKAKKPMTEFLECVLAMIAQKEEEAPAGTRNLEGRRVLYKLRHMRDVLERWKIGGLNRKLQLKPRKWDEFLDADGKKFLRCAEVQLILKWGGNLTKLGEKQAISLGERFRNTMYPNTPGGGILRLHSTFRHDMKIKTSDEGRVMKTAAAFAKGLLELEGSIPPILVSLVHKEKDSLHMLDPSGNKEVKEELEACKLAANMHLQRDFDVNTAPIQEIEAAVGPRQLTSMTEALRKVNNPRKALFTIRDIIGVLLEQLDDMLGVMASDVENKDEGGEGLLGEEDDDEALSGIKLYKGETLLELTERWRLLHTKLYDEDTDEFDLTRVPDVHDNVRFDMLHNPHLGLTSTLEKLYNLAKVMADCVVPQEYGTTIDEKRSIGDKMCHALLDKIKYDLIIARTDNQVDMRYMINLDYSADIPINTLGRRVRTRLYFTSESHLHTLLNVLRFPSKASGGNKTPLSKHGADVISSAPELCYLTQVVIRLFENLTKEPSDPKRFRIEILFSPGATATPLHMSELKRNEDASRFDTEPLQRVSSDYLTCQEVEDYFSESIREGETVEEEEDDALSTTANAVKGEKVKEVKESPKEHVVKSNQESAKYSKDKPVDRVPSSEPPKRSVVIAEEKNLEIEPEATFKRIEGSEQHVEEETADAIEPPVSPATTMLQEEEQSDEGEKLTALIDKGTVNAMARILSKQFFWTSIATISFVLGIGILVVSREVSTQKNFKTRRWSRR